jgi:hypothetical protein
MKHFNPFAYTLRLFSLVFTLLLCNSIMLLQGQTIFSDNFNRPDGPFLSPWQVMNDTLFIQSQQAYARAGRYGLEMYSSPTDSSQTVQLRVDFNFANDSDGRFQFFIMGSYIYGVGYGYIAKVSKSSLDLYTVVPEAPLFVTGIALQGNVTYTLVLKAEASNETVTASLLNQGVTFASVSAPSPKRYFNTVACGIENSASFGKTFDNVFFEKSTTVGIIEQSAPSVPKKFALQQNYPNPFNPTTTIKFSLPKAVHVSLRIYNTLGQEVAQLVSKDLIAGTYISEWNASGFASGVYYYRLQAGNFVETKKLTLIK